MAGRPQVSWPRRETRQVRVRGVAIGGGAAVSVQTMTKTDTADVAATVAQIKQALAAGADLVRLAVPNQDAARGFADIRQQLDAPLVADIHFDYKLALAAIAGGADKIRINPGNIGDVFSTIGDHLQTLFTNTTLLNWDPDIADLEATRPIAQAGDIMHGLANLMLPLVMGGDMDPDTLAIVTEVMHFIASPVTGLLMGALGPVLSPLVEFGNSVGDIFASLGGEDPLSVLQELYDLPARVLGSIFNGSELSLDFLIPLIADAGVLPEGLEIESLSLGLGGLLSPGLSGLPVGGDIDQMAEDLINTGIGGSLWNSVGLVIPGVFELDANGVGPLGSLVAFSQIVAGAIGWEGGGNPLADLSYPIMPILDWFGGEG